MPDIKITPLGAGQYVGRSCVLVSIGTKNVMSDCCMHMGYNDERRFPDFSYITRDGPLNEFLDFVIVTHFHLDHCGSLPYMSEMVGFGGPIYMTHPTKAICPILLEDYRKITMLSIDYLLKGKFTKLLRKIVKTHRNSRPLRFFENTNFKMAEKEEKISGKWSICLIIGILFK